LPDSIVAQGGEFAKSTHSAVLSITSLCFLNHGPDRSGEPKIVNYAIDHEALQETLRIDRDELSVCFQRLEVEPIPF